MVEVQCSWVLVIACTTESEPWNKRFIEFGLKDCVVNRLIVLSLVRKVSLLVWLANFNNFDMFINSIKTINYSPMLKFPSKSVEQRFGRCGITEIIFESIVWINSCEYICRFHNRRLMSRLLWRRLLFFDNNIDDVLADKFSISRKYLVIQQNVIRLLVIE